MNVVGKITKSSLAIAVLLVIASIVVPSQATAAPCQVPTTDYGSATTTLTIPSTAVYRLWSRILAPDSSNNSYLLEVDGTTCYTVGGGATQAGVWTWVDYQNGSTSSKIQQSLSQGSHSLRLIGNKPGLKLDRVIAISDLSCVPTGLGDDCNKPDDATPPTVALSAPADGATVSGSTAITATASDNVAVTKVEFYANSALIGTSTTSPYGATWDTLASPNGSYLITARAYDAAGNIATDSNPVTVQNGDQQAPAVPTNVTATASAYNAVSITWNASTDNVGVAGYTIRRNGVFLTTVNSVNFQDTTVSPNTSYSYQIGAFDAANNKSAFSTAATVQTPSVPDTQAPTVPQGLGASAASASQINLTWQASSDNIGVVGYEVYRGNTKIATVTTTSFGDTGLQPNTAYTYSVLARDAAGNVSARSASVSATTKAPQVAAVLKGKVTDRRGRPLAGVRVTVPIGTTNKLVTRTRTDGTYSLTMQAGGRYSVTYNKSGYISKSFILVLSDGAVLTQNVVLVKK